MKSDKFSFIGTTDKVSEAFPDILSLSITVSQDPHGFYAKRPEQRTSYYSLDNLSPLVGCLNPRCQQGGLELQNIINYHDDGEYKFFCNGHEGTPKGRIKGGPCDNSFKVSLTVKRKD